MAFWPRDWVINRCSTCGKDFYSEKNCSTQIDGGATGGSSCAECMTEQIHKCKRERVECREIMEFLSLKFESEEADDMSKGDVVIVVQGRAEEALHAHKFILSNRSPVFRSMFTTTMLEAERGTVNIDDAPLNVIRAVIKFCYDGQVSFTDDVTAEGVLKVAHKYHICYLQKVCEEHLRATINGENLQNMFKIARKFEANILEKAAIQFFKNNFDKVIPDFLAAVIMD